MSQAADRRLSISVKRRTAGVALVGTVVGVLATGNLPLLTPM
jgi:hypothetical protein